MFWTIMMIAMATLNAASALGACYPVKPWERALHVVGAAAAIGALAM